jgi:hypothetical protein
VKKELADFILRACEHNELLFSNQGLELPELREEYQGRGGIFGSCDEPSFAIVFDGSIFTLMAAIAIEALELCEDDEPAVNSSQLENWSVVDLTQLAKLNQDSMGRSSVIY